MRTTHPAWMVRALRVVNLLFALLGAGGLGFILLSWFSPTQEKPPGYPYFFSIEIGFILIVVAVATILAEVVVWGMRRGARWAKPVGAVIGGLQTMVIVATIAIAGYDQITKTDRLGAYFGFPPAIRASARPVEQGIGVEVTMDWSGAQALRERQGAYSPWYPNTDGILVHSGRDEVTIPADPEVEYCVHRDEHRGRRRILIFDRRSGVLTALVGWVGEPFPPRGAD